MAKSVGTRWGLGASAAVLAGMLTLSFWAWMQLPEDARIPVHWGLDGEPDRYGGKLEALFILPIVTLLVSGIMAFVPRVEPRKAHFAQSGRAYLAIWIAVMAVMAIAHGSIVFTALGYKPNVHLFILLATGLLFILIGLVLPGIQSNFLMGIRTPWTLTSELAWRKTHELGGRIFFLLGLLFVLSAFLPPSGFAVLIIVGATMASVAVLVVYSYIVWRSDGAR